MLALKKSCLSQSLPTALCPLPTRPGVVQLVRPTSTLAPQIVAHAYQVGEQSTQDEDCHHKPLHKGYPSTSIWSVFARGVESQDLKG